MIRMNEKLTALFIGIQWFRNCGKHFRSSEDENIGHGLAFNTCVKDEVRALYDFQKFFIVHSCHSRTHWWEF